jgi:hypothetical protein
MDGIEDRCMHATGGTEVHKTGGQFSWKLVSFAENCLDEIIIVIEFWKNDRNNYITLWWILVKKKFAKEAFLPKKINVSLQL